MQLKDAILQARKQKCKLNCPSLNMEAQDAKSLIHWLFIEEIHTSVEFLNATDWELEAPTKTFHVRYIKNCESKLKSFETEKQCNDFLNTFKEDHEDNYIDLVFDGVIKHDLLSGGK